MAKDDITIFECACGSTYFKLHKHGQVQCVECRDYYNDIVVTFPKGVPGPRKVRKAA